MSEINNLLKKAPSNSTTCNICHKTLTTSYTLAHHIKTIHNGHKKFKCQICDFKFGLSVDLERHVRVHTTEKPYNCPKCPKSFARPQYRQYHLLSVHQIRKVEAEGVVAIKHICPTCGRECPTRSKLKTHQKLVHSEDKPYECSTCGKSFKTRTNLRIHANNIHNDIGGKKTFPCKTCNKMYNTESGARRHWNSAHSAHRPYSCEVCNKSFYESNKCKTHAKTHMKPHLAAGAIRKTKHLPAKNLRNANTVAQLPRPRAAVKAECEVCQKTLQSASALRRHHLTVHSQQRPHACDICHKKFKLKEHLLRHIATHSGERPYSCHICHRTFKSSRSCGEHVQNVHLEVNRTAYNCIFCEMRLASRKSLFAHIRRHTGE